MNIDIQVFVWTYIFCFLDHTHKNEITKQYGNFMLNSYMNYQAVLYTEDIILQSIRKLWTFPLLDVFANICYFSF